MEQEAALQCVSCPAHASLLLRVGKLEGIPTVVEGLRGAVEALTEQVVALNINVTKMRDERGAFIPWYMKVIVAVPSVVVTMAGMVWIAEHMLRR